MSDRECHPLRYPLRQCPACHSEHLDPVAENDTADVHFLCRTCKRCWHVELGYVHRMSPHVCHRCPYLGECRPAFDADRPALSNAERDHLDRVAAVAEAIPFRSLGLATTGEIGRAGTQ
jgi:hypothetical protein